MRIETSTKCHCGTYIETGLSIRGGWHASCPRCIDPEGDSVFERIQGLGQTPGDALFDWERRHEEVLEDEGYPVSSMLVELARQVSEEAERQRGWSLVADTATEYRFLGAWWYGPEAA